MKRFIAISIAILTMTTSQANMNLSGNEHSGKHTTIASPAKTVTRNVWVSASAAKIPKFKLLRGNPYRITHRIIDDSDEDFIDDEGIITSYRRRDLQKIEHDDEISDEVQWKLFLARQLALMKYREKFG